MKTLSDLAFVFPVGRVLTVYGYGEFCGFTELVNPTGPIGVANMRSICELAPELAGKSSPLGMFPSDIELSDESYESLKRAIAGLADYPIINDDMLFVVENRFRTDWWYEYGGQREVNLALWNAAYDAGSADAAREIGSFGVFVKWARKHGIDLSEYEHWDGCYYNPDLSWVEAAAAAEWQQAATNAPQGERDEQ